jgi:hypothetical protein
LCDEVKSSDKPNWRTPVWLAVAHPVISAGVICGFCCVIVAAGHGIGPLVWQLRHADLRSCLTLGCACMLLASHLLSNPALAAVLRFFGSACLVVIWLVSNIELKMFSEVYFAVIVCFTSIPFRAASLAEAVFDGLRFRTRLNGTITIRDLMVLILIAAGFAVPAALFK